MSVIDIQSFDQFEQILMNQGDEKHQYEHIVVDFYGTHCPPCKTFSPIFDQLAKKYENTNICFLKVNIQNYKSDLGDIASECMISNIPSVVFLNVGNWKTVMTTLVGAAQVINQTETSINQWINESNTVTISNEF